MVGIINEHCFEGDDYDRYFKAARQGMLRPEPDKLKVGHVYYRIGHSKRNDGSEVSDDGNLSSGWWLDFETYQSLMQFASRNGISGTVATRVRCAVAPAFGQSDRIYSAGLAAGLRVFIGAGRPIESEGSVYFPPGDVKQIFIPGMSAGRGMRSDVSRNAFPSFEVKPVGAPVMLVRGE